MKKQLKITWSVPKRDLKVNRVSKTKKQILEIISREVEGVVEHFNIEDGGWKLSNYYLQSEIIRNILGFSIEDEINQALINEGLVIEYNNGMTFIRTKEEYQPIYMNERTGKLHVVKDSDDKSYVFKFRQCDGYVFIGNL